MKCLSSFCSNFELSFCLIIEIEMSLRYPMNLLIQICYMHEYNHPHSTEISDKKAANDFGHFPSNFGNVIVGIINVAIVSSLSSSELKLWMFLCVILLLLLFWKVILFTSYNIIFIFDNLVYTLNSFCH